MVDPGYNWTGFYVGGNVGYSWGRSNDTSNLNNGAGTTLFTSLGGSNLDGVVGGGQAGYNWQVQNWVWGFEGDIQGTDERGSRAFTCPVGICSPSIVTNTTTTTTTPVVGFFAAAPPTVTTTTTTTTVTPRPRDPRCAEPEDRLVRNHSRARRPAGDPEGASLRHRRSGLWRGEFQRGHQHHVNVLQHGYKDRLPRPASASKERSAATGPPSSNIFMSISAGHPDRSQPRSLPPTALPAPPARSPAITVRASPTTYCGSA